MLPFFVFLFCLCATYGTYLLVTRKTAEDQERMDRRMREVLLGLDAEAGAAGGGISADQVRLARDECGREFVRLVESLQGGLHPGRLQRPHIEARIGFGQLAHVGVQQARADLSARRCAGWTTENADGRQTR